MTIILTSEEAQQVLDALEDVMDDAEEPHKTKNAFEFLRAKLNEPEPEQIEIETLKQCLFQMQEASKEQTKAFDRLVRIMGTFDLATGHADGWNDLLDSLESELRDVLGHYREALKARQEPDPVAWRFYYKNMWSYVDNINDLSRHKFEPLYIAPPQREWQGLTDEEIKKLFRQSRQPGGAVCRSPEQIFVQNCRTIEAKLREKNT